MAIDAGELNCKVAIEQETFGTPNAEGEKPRTWTTYKNAWVQIVPASGREVERFKSIHANISHRMKTYYQGGVTPKMRVRYGTRLFAINAVIDPDERKREMHLFCTEAIPDA